MADKILNGFDVWITAQGVKSRTRLRSVENVSLEGLTGLRRLILKLAVQGKLVSQNNADEPATALLRVILNEKERLAKEGKTKIAQLPEISSEEKEFEIPKNWIWTRLNDVFIIQDSLRKPVNSAERESRQGEYAYYGANGQVGTIDDYIFEGERILVAEDGGFFDNPIRGVAYLVDGKYWVNNHAHVLQCLGGTIAKYWVCYFNQMNWTPLVRGMTRDKLNQATLINIPIPLPPLEEQHRIVAKVDELMALCDELEKQETNHLKSHQLLVETLLGTLTRAANANEFQQAWSQLEQHFDDLFTTEDSIDQLKQTILQLAVMGKLVPQDPNDEPASVLLERIRKERKRLVEEKKLGKQGVLNKIQDSERAHQLPRGWIFERFGEIVFNRDAERIPLSVDERSMRKGEFDYYGASGVIDNIDAYLFDKPLLLIGEDGANLINRTTPIAFIARGKYWVNNHAHVIDGLSEDLLLYVCLYINAISLEPYVTGTAQPKMNQVKMNSIVISLPPQEEQKRIVAKVDELFALCERLKERIAELQKVTNLMAEGVMEQIH